MRQATATGRITRERDGQALPEKADAQWTASSERAPGDRPGRGAGLGRAADLMQVRLEKLEVKVEHTRVEFDRLHSHLVEKAVISRRVFEVFRQERDAWLAWPARVWALMADALGVPHPAPHALLEEQVRTHLAELAEQLTHDL